MFERVPNISEDVVGYRVKGKVRKEDYEALGLELERLVAEQGKLRMLVDWRGFEGIEPGTVLADLQLDMEHSNNIEKLSVVGNHKWEEWLTTLSKPFISGEVKYFDESRTEEAKEWAQW
jgi:hypothetical protein